MRILAILLSWLLTLPGGGVMLSADAAASGVLSEAGLAGVRRVLAETRLIVSAQGFDLLAGDNLLLWARPEAVVCGGAAAPLTEDAAPGDALSLAAEMGELLAPWMQEKAESVDLQEAGTARRQLVYTLEQEDFAALWPDISRALSLEGQDVSLSGKATFKRYFTRDGQEIGAYFYAAALEINGQSREVRLEYGRQAGKGLYLAFRCPPADQGEDTRITLHARERTGGLTLNAELRETRDGKTVLWSLQGKTDGKLTLSADQTTLTLQMGGEQADYTLTRGKEKLLSGTVSWQEAALPSRQIPEPLRDMEAVSAALAPRLLDFLRREAPDSWQQVLHFLSPFSLNDPR